MKFTGTATGERGLREWEEFITAVKVRFASTTIANSYTGKFEWMWPHAFYGMNNIVRSGRGFETPVKVHSKVRPLTPKPPLIENF